MYVDQIKRLKRLRELLELDVTDLAKVPDQAEYMLGHMLPIRFDARSPWPEDDRFFGRVDLRIAKYPLDDVSKYRLMWATVRCGVVGGTTHGWLYLRDAVPPVLREATKAEVSVLPHLPERWEAILVNAV